MANIIGFIGQWMEENYEVEQEALDKVKGLLQEKITEAVRLSDFKLDGHLRYLMYIIGS